MLNMFDAEAKVVSRRADGLVPERIRSVSTASRRASSSSKVMEERRLSPPVEKDGEEHDAEPPTVPSPFGDRSGVPIEPYLTEQWYADAETLAGARDRRRPRRRAPSSSRRTGRRPSSKWMENIQPWCISRQLWWGTRSRRGMRPDGGRVVRRRDAKQPKRRPRPMPGLRQAHDLAHPSDEIPTCSTPGSPPRCGRSPRMGWPDETPELARYYPTSVLVTAFDIIFFWVARMMMFGLHFMKEVPFHDVYIHALVRDEKGRRCRSRRGTSSTPSCSSTSTAPTRVRFTLAAMAAQGRDIKLAESRVEGYRNFATKLWNAARFGEHYDCKPVEGFDPATAKETLNRWIATESDAHRADVTAAIEAYRFNEAAAAIYRFTWNQFCDWYLELTKPVLNGDESAGQGRDAGDGRLGARSHHRTPPSVHAVHHRGAVGAGRAARARAQPVARACVRGRHGGGRDQLADRASSPRCARCGRR